MPGYGEMRTVDISHYQLQKNKIRGLNEQLTFLKAGPDRSKEKMKKIRTFNHGTIDCYRYNDCRDERCVQIHTEAQARYKEKRKILNEERKAFRLAQGLPERRKRTIRI